jgi:two-component system NarL family sensor kinase
MLWNLLERDSKLDPEMRKVLSECAAVNKRITEEVRTLSYLLHPPLIEELGLGPALKWYVEGFSARSGIDISVEFDPEFPRLTPEAEIALFRIVQESLTNVHRYSGSTRGYVRLIRKGDEIALEIRDFGKGFEPGASNLHESTPPLGVGILGMRERVRQLSGRLEISSRENEGTLVSVVLPVHKGAVASPNGGNRDSTEPSTRKPTRKAAKAR